MHKWQHGVAAQIPRNSLIMLIAALTMVTIPHLSQISPWIIAAGLFCAWWRWMIFLGRRNFLKFWQKAVLVVICGAAVVISEGVTQNLETWAALLVMAFALKLLEMKTQRDAYVVVFIAYFVIAIEFLFNTSIGIVAYELCALILVTAAMVGMNQFHTRVKLFESLKVASKILAQAIPLMIVLFVLFPRIGPMWSIASPNQQARSGLSSEMTPGDIAKLTRSDEIAFRAIFKDTPPANDELYWRGRVYANFENGKWSEAKMPRKFSNLRRINWQGKHKKSWFIPDTLTSDSNDKKLSYSVLLEPTSNRWLIGLDLAIPKTTFTGLNWDFKLINRKPVQSLLRYEIDTYPEAKLNPWLPEFLKLQTTRIDKTDNPKTIRFAKNLYAQSGNAKEFVNQVLEHIRNEPYHYTLEPPTLNKDHSIDQFWFTTRQGFCTHYAGAMVYMLRAAGIPARMVGGYQGGEINPLTGHVVVRQYLAHAWVEYWEPKKGWQRVDPTAAVAPSRIHDSLSAALTDNDLSSLSLFTNARLNGLPGLQKMLFLFESLEHRWNLFVIGYNSKRQTDFLEKLLGKITPAKIGLLLLYGALLSSVFVAFSLLWSNRNKQKNPVINAFQQFTKRLRKHGIERRPEETPTQFIENIGASNNLPSSELLPSINLLNSLLYDPNTEFSKQKLDNLKSELKLLFRKISPQTANI